MPRRNYTKGRRRPSGHGVDADSLRRQIYRDRWDHERPTITYPERDDRT